MFRYLRTVSLVGPASSAVVAVSGFADLGRDDIFPAVIVTILTAAVRYPLQLRHRTMALVGIVGYLAMILSLPLTLPGVLSLVAKA